MSDPAPSLARPLLVRPLLISLLPVAALLLALNGPIRGRLERAEAEDCARSAENLAGLLTAMSAPPADFPRPGPGGGRERILLLDGARMPALDSSSPRAQHAQTWSGPAAGESLRREPVTTVRDAMGGRQIRAEIRWGEPPAGGALILMRSLAPIDRRLRQAGGIAVGLWAVWAATIALVVLATRRRLTAERDALLRVLDAIPDPPAGIGRAADNTLGMDRSVRGAAERAGLRIAVLGDEIREREAVLHGMLEGVVAIDRDRRVLMVNPSAERMLGVEIAGGRPIAEIVRSAAFHDLVEEILGSERPGEIEFELEGGRRLRVLGDVFRGPRAELRGAVLVMSDVTEIRRLERIRRDFVANVSHELKTPITVIRGYVETLLEEPGADPEQRASFLRTVASNAGRMHRIIEDLLALSRVDSKGTDVDRSEFDVGEMVSGCARDFAAEAKERGVRIEMDLPLDLAPLYANESLLDRALGNLIDNAIKYGARDGAVRVSAREEAGAVLLEVRDDGPGIESAHLPRLFERFYRVDKGRSRELGGTGLGLAIVKHIALAHGGEAEVESRPGAGSTFRIRIPRRLPSKTS
jgi:two-component system phosphate regulon sensor histidine kinase PhoR